MFSHVVRPEFVEVFDSIHSRYRLTCYVWGEVDHTLSAVVKKMIRIRRFLFARPARTSISCLRFSCGSRKNRYSTARICKRSALQATACLRGRYCTDVSKQSRMCYEVERR